MTSLTPAKLINLVLLPLHLGVSRKPDPLQPHQTPQAVSHTCSLLSWKPALSLSNLPIFLNMGRC